MHPVCSIDLDRLPEVRAALTEWVEQVQKRFQLEAVYLFGSFAAGNPHQGSDIDLVLVGPFTGKLPERIWRVLETTDLPSSPSATPPRNGGPWPLRRIRLRWRCCAPAGCYSVPVSLSRAQRAARPRIAPPLTGEARN
jgi:uncharacterized protein